MADSGQAEGQVITTYLAEYNSLRAEQQSRLQSQNQAFNYLLIVVGAGVTAVITTVGKSQELPLVVLAVALFLPLLTAPLGYIFFDNEMAIHSIGAHLYWVWRPNIVALLNNENVFQNSLEFRHLNKSSKTIHQCLSAARWVLFLLPTVVPVIGLSTYTVLNWGWWRTYTYSVPVSGQWRAIIAGCVVIFCLDVLACLLLILAIGWTFRKYKHVAS
jgi:hypothetical protein